MVIHNVCWLIMAVNSQWQQALSIWSIEHQTPPNYNPRANPTERQNQELKRMLWIQQVKDHKAWDQHLPQSLFALCQRVSRITGYSPTVSGLTSVQNQWMESQPTYRRRSSKSRSMAERHQPEIDKKLNEAKLWTLKEAKKQDIEKEKILNQGDLVMWRNQLSATSNTDTI